MAAVAVEAAAVVGKKCVYLIYAKVFSFNFNFGHYYQCGYGPGSRGDNQTNIGKRVH